MSAAVADTTGANEETTVPRSAEIGDLTGDRGLDGRGDHQEVLRLDITVQDSVSMLQKQN